MRRKLGEWLRRYVPAEIGGTLGALAGGLLVYRLSHSSALTAVGGTWGENLGYYLVILGREIGANRSALHQGRWRTSTRMLRNLVVEFGVAEALDSFLLRPLLVYAALSLTGSVPLGLLAGKLAADMGFYTVAIGMYELRKRMFRD